MSTCVGCSAEIAVTASFCPRCGTPNPEAPTIPTPTGGAKTTERIEPDELKVRLQKAVGRDFLVGQLLGEGGFAVVFSVQDRKLSRRIAVKVLRPELTASKSTVQRFVREAESVANLSHPHILPIFFVGEGEGLVYFGMPFVEGETLDARLARDKQLPEPDVVRIGAEVADALAEAHGAGLVHRDVKPANVLLQGAKGRALVADFGIAKAAAGSGDKLTGTGSVIGSPHYMSPEQAAGSGDVDHRSDIYSLGVVLWQMLAGALPFDAPDTQGILVQHLTQPLPPLARRRPGVTPALVKIVERCCAKRPQDRFQSVADVAEALRTGRAPPPLPVRSRRRAALFAGTAAVAVLGAAAIVLPKLRAARRAAGPPAPTADTARSAAPMVAVLPFEVSGNQDTAWARQAAKTVADKVEQDFGVKTVDINRLLGRWVAERRSLTAPLDSNAAFAYRLLANQLVIGNIFAAGRQVQVAADVYDARSLEKIGHSAVEGSPDSLIGLLDRLAARVALALCGQPEFNPGKLCYDVPARSKAPVLVTYAAAPGQSVPAEPAFYLRVSAQGALEDVRQRGRLPSDLVTAALPALQSATYEPARKGNTSVEAWTVVAVTLRAPGAVGVASAARDVRCDSPSLSVSNPNHACYDIRPVPLEPPIIRPPSSCLGTVTPAQVLVHVSPRGEVIAFATPPKRVRSTCRAFDDAALVQSGHMAFRPAQKSGVAVDAWVVVQVIARR